jgi:xanthine dehydrogenase small subunit
MNTQPIRFFHQGRLVEVDGAHTTRTVLEWLREDAHCSGTKEGCNEGDCGACTVVIGELPAPGAASPTPDQTVVRGLQLRAVNACIQFLPTLHGKALFTVEDLRGPGIRPAPAPASASAPSAAPTARGTEPAPLHPVQAAMVECHGSQCGFCTPGFVMTMFATYEHHRARGTRPTRQQLADELSGNLCRCTGYRPILDAGERMFELPSCRLDTAPVLSALRSMSASDETFHYQAPARPSFALPAVVPALPATEATSPTPATPASTPADTERARIDHFFAPRTLPALAALRAERPTARLLAGSTDLGLWVNKQQRDLGDLIYLGNVAALKRIETLPDGALWIGAAASLEEAWAALAQRHPTLTEVWLRFASVPIRHAGTLGGNAANGSPIGDGPPVLMALDATIELRHGESTRSMPLHAFYIDYMKNQLQTGEFVQALVVPPAPAGMQVRAYKISKRFDCDISALCAGLSLRLDGERVKDIRIAFGGLAATVKLAATAQAALIGQPWTQASVHAAQAALAHDFKPLSDMRASAAYRLQVAQNLLQRFWLETRPTDPLPEQATSVWSVMPHAPLALAGRRGATP